jgi:hypothetical protein
MSINAHRKCLKTLIDGTRDPAGKMHFPATVRAPKTSLAVCFLQHTAR